jgi:aminopeptidase
MYLPSQKILKNYADVLIKFALGSGKGIKKGETVFIHVPESAKAMLNPLIESVLEAGGNPLVHFTPEGTDRWLSIDRVFLEKATMSQITYLPKNTLLGRVADCDHFVSIIATNNKQELKGVDTAKIMARQAAIKFYKDARDTKENQGKLTWTLALFGTPAMAREAKLSEGAYWQEIIKACFLDTPNPIAKWRWVFAKQEEIKKKLNKLEIDWLHVEGKNVDLKIRIGKKRKWLGGSGRNIPSFELFTSPDFRGTEGRVYFNEPLYRYGNLVEGVRLEFENGKATKVGAKKNGKIISEMIKVDGANQIGEFSLTDKRFSRITKFMAETLFDENMGGKYGNFHIALGSSYHDAYTGNPANVSRAEWKKLGYNDSAVHTDIVSTEDRTVTATLTSGEKRVIYKNGQFTI